MKPQHQIKKDIVRVCELIDQRQYVGGRDGNVSVRVSETTILITRAGVRKGDVTVDDLLRIDRKGNRLGGRGDPSTETGMHLRIYDRRPDVRAVVHAHPPVSTGFAAAGVAMDECVLPEVIVGLGRVPVARYATPGTAELSASLDPVLSDHDAILLENHGVVTVGADVESAYQRMETVEHAARVLLVARLMGGANPLSGGQVADLLDARTRYGVREGLAACDIEAPSATARGAADDELVERIVARVRRSLTE